MKTIDVFEFYGSQTAAADALGTSKQNVNQWREYPPVLWQYKIQVKTNGALIAEPELVNAPGRAA